MSDTRQARSGFVDVDGTQLYYEVAGAGEPVIFIHAGICDSRMWDDQWTSFAREYRVVRYDVRGFGKSILPSLPYANRDDLHAVFQNLGLEWAHIVAASMAGRIAIEYTLEHPDLVRSLILVGSGVGAAPPSDALQQAWEEVDAAFTAGDLATANAIELRAWVDGPGRAPDQVDSTIRERVREMNANNFALVNEAATEQPLEPSVRERLGELRLPVLIVAGDNDQPHVIASADLFEAGIAGSKKVVMRGTAHLPSMERPDEFNSLVLNFLKGA